MDNPSPSSEADTSGGKTVKVCLDPTEGALLERATLPRAKAVFDVVRHVELKVATPAPFVPCNPSVLWDADRECFLASVRAVDYRLGTPSRTSSSKNYLVTLHTETLELEEQVEIIDRSRTVKNPRAAVHGFEDIRLFWRGSALCGMATTCDLANGGAVPEMCRLRFVTSPYGTCDIVSALPLRGPWSRYVQKNWMVVADGFGTRVIYRLYPTLVMLPEEMMTRWISLDGAEQILDKEDFIPSSARGSSQVLPCNGGWLCIMHEYASRQPIVYGHRFVWLDENFVVRKASEAFSWLITGVEFCAGMALVGERVVASFGVRDRSAHVMEMTLGSVLGRLGDVAP